MPKVAKRKLRSLKGDKRTKEEEEEEDEDDDVVERMTVLLLPPTELQITLR
jgi:hypothetical protein